MRGAGLGEGRGAGEGLADGDGLGLGEAAGDGLGETAGEGLPPVFGSPGPDGPPQAANDRAAMRSSALLAALRSPRALGDERAISYDALKAEASGPFTGEASSKPASLL